MLNGRYSHHLRARKAAIYNSLSPAARDRLAALRKARPSKTGYTCSQIGLPYSMASTAVAARALDDAARSRRSAAKFTRQGALKLALSYLDSHAQHLARCENARPLGSNLPG